MLDQYYLYRPHLIGVAYVYGFIGLLGMSIDSLRQPSSLTEQLFGLIGLGASAWLLLYMLRKVGLIEDKSQPVIASQPNQPADLLRAKLALIRRLEAYDLSHQSVPTANEDVPLMVTKDKSHGYRCRYQYHDTAKGICYSYDYSIDLNRKTLVYVKKSETLSLPDSDKDANKLSVCYEFSQPQPASHDELFELYRRLGCLVE